MVHESRKWSKPPTFSVKLLLRFVPEKNKLAHRQKNTIFTLDIQTGVVSDEDTPEIWETVKKDAIQKVRGNKNRGTRADSPMVDEKKVEKSF